MTTLAGGPFPGYADGVGTAARCARPAVEAVLPALTPPHPSAPSFSGACALALDPLRGVLYVADSGNGRVRAVTLTGTVSTLAGGGAAPVYNSSADSDGVGTYATLVAPSGLAWLEAEGLLLLAEAGGSRLRTINVSVRPPRCFLFRIRRNARILTAPSAQTGEVTTVAGGMRGGSGLRDGVGVGALLNAPAGLAASSLAVGAAAFLADAGSHALRAVSLAVAAKLTREYTEWSSNSLRGPATWHGH